MDDLGGAFKENLSEEGRRRRRLAAVGPSPGRSWDILGAGRVLSCGDARPRGKGASRSVLRAREGRDDNPASPEPLPRDRPGAPSEAEDRALLRRYRRAAPAPSSAAASATATNSHPPDPGAATPEPQGFISPFDPLAELVAEVGDVVGVGGVEGDEDGLKITST